MSFEQGSKRMVSTERRSSWTRGTGRDSLERPALDRLRDLVRERCVGRIYVQAPDRIASGGRLKA